MNHPVFKQLTNNLLAGFSAGLLFAGVRGLLFGLTSKAWVKVRMTDTVRRWRVSIRQHKVKNELLSALGVGVAASLLLFDMFSV